MKNYKVEEGIFHKLIPCENLLGLCAVGSQECLSCKFNVLGREVEGNIFCVGDEHILVDTLASRCEKIVLGKYKFSTRTKNMFKNHDIYTLKDLVACTEDEIIKYRNIGKVVLTEIKDFIAQMQEAGLDIELGMKL